jgi:hypothetical protein
MISGLVCNVEKTMLMVIGVEAPIDQRIKDLGFTITDSVTILGLNLNRNGVMGNNYQKIGQKIQGAINHWRPFNLSLPGRISIAKCMMYSQINYLGCFIPIPDNFITEYDRMITSFVKGKLNIAKKRLYLPPAHGGLGLFILDDYLDAQRCSWIKRCVNLDEAWKITIYVKNFANVFNSKARNINQEELPLTFAICKSFERVSNKFTQTNENFRESFIFENVTIPINLETRPCLTRSMFNVEFFNQNAVKLYKLKYSDFYARDDSLIDIDTVREATGINFTVLHVYTIRGACSAAKIKYKKRDIELQKITDIVSFSFRRRRGSSHFRKLLGTTALPDTSRNINRFADIVDIVINGEQSKFLNQLWTNGLFNNRERTVLFKLYNNTLGYNAAVAHFVRNHSPICTFCDIMEEQDQNRETPVHLFFDCGSVSNIIDNAFKKLTNDPNFLFSRREFFATFERRELSIAKNRILTYFSTFLKLYIWDCRNRGFIPTEDNCWANIEERISDLCRSNTQFSTLWGNTGFVLNNP